VIVAAGIGIGPAAQVAQGMRHQLNLRPASRAEIFAVSAMNPARASAAAGRIKPVHQPIKTFGKVRACGELHRTTESTKFAPGVAKLKTKRETDAGYDSTIKKPPVISIG
jgi:hypothetical protein